MTPSFDVSIICSKPTKLADYLGKYAKDMEIVEKIKQRWKIISNKNVILTKKKCLHLDQRFKKVACLTRKKKNRGLQPTKKINRKKATPKMLIFQAIVEAPNQQLNLCDIYAWFQANFLHFRSSNLTWKVKIKNIT